MPLGVDAETYIALSEAFEQENILTQQREQVDTVPRTFLPDSHYIIDHFSMVIFRIRDDQGDTSVNSISNSPPSRGMPPAH